MNTRHVFASSVRQIPSESRERVGLSHDLPFPVRNPSSGQMDGQNLSDHLSTISEFSSDTTSARSRLQSLYSDIVARKELNPAGFHANVAWWRRLLEGALRLGLLPGGDHLVLHVNDYLLEALRWNPLGRPLAIPSVIVRSLSSIIEILLT